VIGTATATALPGKSHDHQPAPLGLGIVGQPAGDCAFNTASSQRADRLLFFFAIVLPLLRRRRVFPADRVVYLRSVHAYVSRRSYPQLHQSAAAGIHADHLHLHVVTDADGLIEPPRHH
jgi:hypothetical protein